MTGSYFYASYDHNILFISKVSNGVLQRSNYTLMHLYLKLQVLKIERIFKHYITIIQ